MTDLNVFQQLGASIVEPSDAEARKFLADMKRAARELDPATAEVELIYTGTSDVYGMYPYRDDSSCEYFARAPGSDVWVCEEDWPRATRKALEKRGALAEAMHRRAIHYVKWELANAERVIAKDLERGGWSANEAAALIEEAREVV
jgi:hypothetical protein